MASLKEIILFLRSNGLGNNLRNLQYSWKKGRLDRRYLAGRTVSPVISPGQLLSAAEVQGGGRFQFENAALEILFLAPDLARLSWDPGIPPLPYALARTDWPVIETSLCQVDSGYKLTAEGLSVMIQDDGSLEFNSPSGKVLRREQPPLRQGEAWTHRAVLQPGECLYGLGEQAGRLNLRSGGSPVRHRLWNSDPGGSYGPGSDPIYMPFPVYHGLHADGSYLIFHENYHSADWRITHDDHPEQEPDMVSVQFDRGMLRTYFISGPPTQTLPRYTELTGRAPLPPRWSLGYHQCRWGYRTAADIRAVAAGFREHNLPLEAIHLDIDYMDGCRVFTVDKQRFPDLEALAAELANTGVRLVTILDPGVKVDQGYQVYRQGIERGVFCKLPNGNVLHALVWPGWSVFPDFTNPKTRLWWGEYYQSLLNAGVAGFWHDMNEPTSFTFSGDMTLPLATHHDFDGQGGNHIQAHNLYALLMNQAGFEAFRKIHPDRRPWLISRSGWAGQQRYAWNWTADTESTWEGLRMTIPSVLGLGLSGIPFTGPDIGGFSGNPSAELYLRWFQLAAFLPYFRTHSSIGTAPREPWVYGEPVTSIVRHFMRLRQRLMPYLYTLAWESSQNGLPLIRPIFWKHWDQAALWEVDDAFLLGDDMLVAPVLEKNSSHRKVMLPPGTWYSFWDDSQYRGPGEIQVDNELETIPIFVREGGLIPTQEDGRLILHLYPPPETTGQPGIDRRQLYSDAGEGYGDCRIDYLTLARDGSHITLEWEDRGNYPFPYTGVGLELHALSPDRIWLDGRELAAPPPRYTVGIFNQLVFEA